MIDISGSIFVCTAYVDMRKSIDGLSQLVFEFMSITSLNSIKSTPEVIDIGTSVFVFIKVASVPLVAVFKSAILSSTPLITSAPILSLLSLIALLLVLLQVL